MTSLPSSCLERPGWWCWSELATSGHTSLPPTPRNAGSPELWVPGQTFMGWADQQVPHSLPRQAQVEFLACPCPPSLDARLCSRLCPGMASPY